MVNSTATPDGKSIATPAPTNCVVELTFSIDTTSQMPHREGNAAVFGMCAGLAFPTAAHMKGGI